MKARQKLTRMPALRAELLLAFPQRLRRRHVVLARREDGARLDRDEALMRDCGGAAGKHQQPAGGERPGEGDHCAMRDAPRGLSFSCWA